MNQRHACGYKLNTYLSRVMGRRRRLHLRETSAWRHTLDVNENYSTATCFDCERPLVDVRTNIPFRTREGHLRFKDNRGCKRCTSDTCRSAFPFKGRDFNAALNIVRITVCMLQGVPRPRCYTRAHHDEHQRARRGGPAA